MTTFPEKTVRYREVVVVGSIVVAISCILWWRFLPLPHQDLGFYTEPAYLLAQFGRLAGPGSQYVDLTYQKGIYNYPPGHFLLLAGWMKLFGFSADSLLAYTHAVHAGMLVTLWALLRFRYGCSKLISWLVLLSMFPRMAFGRPDLPACFLSLAAWLALPEEENRGRYVASGCLAGATLLVSPGYGIATLATLIVLTLVREGSRGARLRALFWWGFSAALIFGGALAAVLQWQHSWNLAYVQFKTNATIRGAQVNAWPDFHLLFTYVFSVIPFLLLAVAPAIAAALATWKKQGSQLRTLSLAFLAAAAIWMMLNRQQLLFDHHYLFPAKSIFMGVLFSRWKFPFPARAIPLLLLSAIGFYNYKADFLYLASPLRASERTNAATVKPEGEIAVDSVYFTRFYEPGHTLNYEVVDGESYWSQYLAAIPPSLRTELMSGLPDEPERPSMLIVSAYTMSHYGELYLRNPGCTGSPGSSARLHVMGRTWNLPAEPYKVMVCRVSGP